MITETANETQSSLLDLQRTVLAERIKSGDFTVPVLPQVAQEALSLSNDPNADIGDLSKLIHKDQALASHILRIANSAAFGGCETIVSLKQAVARIGMRLMSDIAIAVALQGEGFQVKGFEEEVKNLWKNALASGAYGKEIALINRRNLEGQFLCGLLHTIGKPVVLKTVTEIRDMVEFDLDWDSTNSLLDEFHCQVGETVAISWKLPPQVTSAIGNYRDYANAPAFREECAMTYLSDRLANWAINPDKVSVDETVDDPVFAELNFYPDDIEKLLQKRDDIVSIVSSMEL